MSTSLSHYSKIKDKYCICYFGCCNDYIVQLLYLRPYIEEQLPGLNIYICCRESLSYLVSGFKNIVFNSEIHTIKKNFAYIHVLQCDMQSHPIMDLFEQSNLILPKIKVCNHHITKKCAIYPKGFLPTKSLLSQDVNHIKQKCSNMGYATQIEGDMNGVDWVIGVENEYLFLAAFQGIKTSLIPTGIGTELYEKLFQGEIIYI